MLRRLTFALLALGLVGRSAALEVTPLDDRTVSVHLASEAATRQDALLEAKKSAVMATAGRVLLDDALIRGDELMAKYLSLYAPEFVTGVEVLDDTFQGGKTRLTSRVFINYAKLQKDLLEKRFLFAPAYKPLVGVFVQERVEEEQLKQEVARELLQNALQVEGLKSFTGRISDPPASTDVVADPLLLRAAIVASERRNVEIILSGTSETTLDKEMEIYYDKFYFYNCKMTMTMLRVDTGEVLFKTDAEGSASSRDRADAIRLAIERASNQVASAVSGRYKEFWPEVVQSKSDYEILFTGTDEELTRIVTQQLERVSPDTRINLKKTFDRSALLAVSSSAPRDRILENLKQCPYPTLNVVREVGKDKFEVQVLVDR